MRSKGYFQGSQDWSHRPCAARSPGMQCCVDTLPMSRTAGLSPTFRHRRRYIAYRNSKRINYNKRFVLTVILRLREIWHAVKIKLEFNLVRCFIVCFLKEKLLLLLLVFLWNLPDCVLGFSNVWPWWPLWHFEKPRLFHLNTEMVIKRGFNAFCWLCRDVLLYLERPLEKFESLLRSLKIGRKLYKDLIMRNFTWNRFPIKNSLFDSLLTPIVDSTYFNRGNSGFCFRDVSFITRRHEEDMNPWNRKLRLNSLGKVKFVQNAYLLCMKSHPNNGRWFPGGWSSWGVEFGHRQAEYTACCNGLVFWHKYHFCWNLSVAC